MPDQNKKIPSPRSRRNYSGSRSTAVKPVPSSAKKPLAEQVHPDLVNQLISMGDMKIETKETQENNTIKEQQNKKKSDNNTGKDTQQKKNNLALSQAESIPKARTQAPPRRRRAEPRKIEETTILLPTATTPQKNRRRGKRVAGKHPSVRIIPLGGLGEVGKNVTVYECDNDAFLVDCGMTFPDDAMPGVDLVIPDFTYLEDIKDKLRGIVITHAHEDHIGAIPYLLKKINLPLYGTRLTLGLIENKLKEHGILNKTKMNVQKPGDNVKLGCMSVEFINVNHSIPDACAFAITTPAGIIVQTGDFKIDFTPIRGDVINLARFGELGRQGVLALLSDSTNAERPGSTASERTVGESLDKLFVSAARKRIIVATFASNVHRVQQIVDAAVKYKRKVCVSGRSMENMVEKALELGYLEIPDGIMVDVDVADRYPADKLVIITTGSQGEPMSALTRMSTGDHRKVTVKPNDCIIISATPIPGNEKLVTKVINELLKQGAEVIYERMYDVHVSGHACQDELKMMISLVKPKFFMPMHGEYKHLKKHADLARSMGVEPQNIVISDIGQVIETDGDRFRQTGTVTAGKVLVDGLGVGDVGSIVLRDRKHLAQDGLIVLVASIDGATGKLLAGPDIVSRGFVYVRESEDMMAKIRKIAKDTIQRCIDNNTREWGIIKQRIRDDIGDYLWQVTKRSPMILPVVQEIRQ